MSEETAPAAAARPGQLRTLMTVCVLLAVVAVVVRWNDLVRAFEPTEDQPTAMFMQPPFGFPKPLGPAEAKVRAHIIAHPYSGCQRTLIALWMGIASLEPQRLRVDFSESWEQEVRGPGGQVVPMAMLCQSGVELNGKTDFKVGEGAAAHTVQLHGPAPRPPLASGGPPQPGDTRWTNSDLAAILNKVMREKYGSDHRLTGAAITEAAKAASARIPPASK